MELIDQLDQIINKLHAQFPSQIYIGKQYTIKDLKDELSKVKEDIIKSQAEAS